MNARPFPVRMAATVQIWRTAISAPAKEKYSLNFEVLFYTIERAKYIIHNTLCNCV